MAPRRPLPVLFKSLATICLPADSGGPGAMSPVGCQSQEEDDGIKVPGIIPPNVLPLQSESAAGTVPRYSTAIERLLEARGERTTARLGFKGLGDAGATEVRCCFQAVPTRHIP